MLTKEELEQINRFSKAELTADQVYTFSVRLCDNEVDWDFERFGTEDLERLGELFLGKSGIFDHQWFAKGQTARIYRTEVVREPGTVTAAGDEYRWLKGLGLSHADGEESGADHRDRGAASKVNEILTWGGARILHMQPESNACDCEKGRRCMATSAIWSCQDVPTVTLRLVRQPVGPHQIKFFQYCPHGGSVRHLWSQGRLTYNIAFPGDIANNAFVVGKPSPPRCDRGH